MEPSELTTQQIAEIQNQIVSAVDLGVIKKGQGPRLMLGGVMATLQTLGYKTPPIWSIWVMSGRDVYTEIKKLTA